MHAAPAAGDKETTMVKGLTAQRLIALFFGGLLAFNFPLLALWDRPLAVLGIPLFPAALFVGWAGLIALLAWILERPDR